MVKLGPMIPAMVVVAGAEVRTGTPFWVIVPEALKSPPCKSWEPENKSVVVAIVLGPDQTAT